MSVSRGDGHLTVAAFVPYALGMAPSQRYRIEQWAPFLSKMDISIVFYPFADEELTSLLQRPGRTLRKMVLVMKGLARRWVQTASLPKEQIVFVHRAACLVGPPIVERWLRRRGHRIVYDFDDAIYLLHSAAANRVLSWLKQPGKTATICRLSHHLSVGNSYLADWARPHNDAVTVVPSSIDTGSYTPRETSSRTLPLVVGWTGSSTSQTYLEAFAPMLKRLVEENDVQVRVISSREPILPGVPCTWRRWSPASEVADIADLDIGIMPMPDEEWALGKCALKALQYMAMGVPTIASAIGANRDVITHGMNGFLATTDSDWVGCVRALIRSPELRGRLGREGRRTVQERFSMTKSAGALARVIRTVAGGTTDRRLE